MPCVNQLVMTCFDTPEANSRSPSVEVIEREMVRSLLARADQRPDHGDGRARHGAAADADVIAVAARAWPPPPATSPSRASRGRDASVCLAQLLVGFDQGRPCSCALVSPRPWSGGGGHAAVAIEGGDHLVPLRHQLVQAAPELLGAAPVEIGERDALLLHPGEIAEIEDALALARRWRRARARCRRRADAGRRSRPPPRRSARRGCGGAAGSAAARCGTSRAPSVATVTIMSSGPSAQCLAILMAPSTLAIEERPKWRERARQLRRHAQPPRQIVAARVGVEHGIEPVGRLVADADHQIGVHDVVDQRHVLVADALDVVLAVAVA